MNMCLFDVIKDIYPHIDSMKEIHDIALDWNLLSGSSLLSIEIVRENQELPWIEEEFQWNK
jgi:hypothetical protein